MLAGKHANVPVAGGSNNDEGDLFIYPYYLMGMDNDKYKDFVRMFLSNGRPFNESSYEETLKMYPPSSQNRKTASSMIADATFVCGAKAVVQSVEKSWLYHFNYGNGPVIHSSELGFVFDNGAGSETLAGTMGTFWQSLAATGTPGTEAQWPAYQNETDKDIIFDKKLTVESGRRLKYCNFWVSQFSQGLQAPDLMGALTQFAAQGNQWPPVGGHKSSLQYV
jgi:carboxylesterase type B